MIIFTPNTVIYSGDVNLNFDDLNNGLNTCPYKAFAYPTASQDVADGAYTKLNFNAELYDPNGNFNTSTYTYTVPVTGYYMLAAQGQGNDANGAIYGFGIHIYVNSTLKVHGAVTIDTAQQGWQRNSTAAGIRKLNAGDTVSVYAYADTSDGGAITVLGGEDGRTSFSIHLLSV